MHLSKENIQHGNTITNPSPSSHHRGLKRGRMTISKWLAILVMTSVLAFLLLPLAGCSEELSPREVVTKACATTSEVQSYRMESSTITTVEGETSESILELEFASPDRWRMKVTSEGGEWMEFINIGDEQYYRDSDTVQWRPSGVPFREKDRSTSGVASVGSGEEMFPELDLLFDLEKLPDEKIDGIDCLHYRGRIDTNRVVEEQKTILKAQLDPSAPEYKEALKSLEQLRRLKTNVELWIDKDDYLIRQRKQEMQMPPMESTTGETAGGWSTSSVQRYYDFNQMIEIEPPAQIP